MQCGTLDWEAVLDTIDPEKYLYWRVKDQLEGIGEKHDDMRFGYLASLILSSQSVNLRADELRVDLECQSLDPPTIDGTRLALRNGFGLMGA